MNKNQQDIVHARSLGNLEAFWMQHAQALYWHKEPRRALELNTKDLRDGTNHRTWTWFPGGEISTSYNCIDRHVEAGNGKAVAIIWESPVTGQREKYSYNQLLDEVQTLAGVLRENGVRKGDVVLIYMPMIPAALIAMLAINRLGAVHAVVFGGFAAPALAQRIESAEPVAVMTASCGIEAGKSPIEYRKLVRDAIGQSSFKPSTTIIWQREQLRWHPVMKEEGERNWQRLVKSAKMRGVKAPVVPIGSSEPVYIIYTSGTTGTPKGVLREAGGHAVGLQLSIRYLFGVSARDVMWTASDIGWVVGHSFILYAPLLAGATTVQFEGKPIWPDAGIFWRTVENLKVNVLFTAPTALRAIRQADPELKRLHEVGTRGGLKTLRTLFLAGERSEPNIIDQFGESIRRHAGPGASVVDNWWSSESGSPMTGVAQFPDAGWAVENGLTSKKLTVQPGSAGKPMPGFDVKVVDDEGNECEPGAMGNIVLGIPLGPTALTTLWKDDDRFWNSYLRRFDGKWFDTGDAGMVSKDGYLSVMSRTDDIINVAAHRLSTGAIEQAICSHPSVAEACVVGMPDALKGQLPFAFVTIGGNTSALADDLRGKLLYEIQQLIRDQIGPIATLGGFIEGKGMIPRTRSGKTLRRVLRDLVENAVRGGFEKDVQVPATIEDRDVVDVARTKIRQYFEHQATDLRKGVAKKAKI